jgi:hypothetical protein
MEANEFYKENTTETTKMLVSPKRVVKETDILIEDETRLQALIKEYQSSVYAIENIIQVKKTEDDYVVIDGVDEAKAAYLANVPYLPIEVIKD